MSVSRLELACDSGLVTWPDGPVVAWRPDPATRGLPASGLTVVHGNKPCVEAWTNTGVIVRTSWDGKAAAGYVQVPRSKVFARKLVAEAAEAVEAGGQLVVDGQKTDGIESLLKEMKPLFTGVEVLSKAHGKLITLTRPSTLPPQIETWNKATSGIDGWKTALSGFSADRVDTGSAVLADHLPSRIKGMILDLGAGWGFLASAVLKSPDVDHIDLVEAEFDALQAAKSNVPDVTARLLWQDALNWSPDRKYDVVVCNPPFHAGRAADPAIGQSFIGVAARCIAPGGTLALVANRHLPYERTLAEAFGQVQTVAEEQGFKVFHAQKPKRTRRKRR